MGAGSKHNMSAGVRFPKDPSQIKHIFRQKEGHLTEDTFENRKLFINTARDSNNYRGTDALGIDWYAKTNPDSSQVWVKVHKGIIRGAGINPTQRPWDNETGFNRNPDRSD
jgi:hypothetical protein